MKVVKLHLKKCWTAGAKWMTKSGKLPGEKNKRKRMCPQNVLFSTISCIIDVSKILDGWITLTQVRIKVIFVCSVNVELWCLYKQIHKLIKRKKYYSTDAFSVKVDLIDLKTNSIVPRTVFNVKISVKEPMSKFLKTNSQNFCTPTLWAVELPVNGKML